MFLKKFLFHFALMVSALLICAPLVEARSGKQEPFNQVVILIDGSGSFKRRQGEAIERTTEILEGISVAEIRRWEKSKDRITIISIDALPEVIWQGSLEDLKAEDTDSWAARFKARTDYAYCTDLGAAFQLARQYLDGDPRYVSRYLFAFTDLINEPPTGSIRTCKRPRLPSPPPEDFPWETFEGVSVNIFWVPPDQKLTWQREAQKRGQASSFSLFTTSESSAAIVKPVPRAELAREVVEERRQEIAIKTKKVGTTFLKWIAKWIAIFLGLVVGIVVIATVATSRISRRRSGNPPPRGPATGRRQPPVPPSTPSASRSLSPLQGNPDRSPRPQRPNTLH